MCLAVLNSYSFPSGHVMFYVGFFGFLWFLVYTLLKRSWRRTLAHLFGQPDRSRRGFTNLPRSTLAQRCVGSLSSWRLDSGRHSSVLSLGKETLLRSSTVAAEQPKAPETRSCWKRFLHERLISILGESHLRDRQILDKVYSTLIQK